MEPGASVTCIPPGEFDSAEEILRPFLENFAERSGGRETYERFASGCREAHYQVWAVHVGGDLAAIALTQILDDATRTCVISHCAGQGYQQWAGDLLAMVKVWSANVGSTKLHAISRPGWERALRSFGMVKTHVVLELREDEPFRKEQIEQ